MYFAYAAIDLGEVLCYIKRKPLEVVNSLESPKCSYIVASFDMEWVPYGIIEQIGKLGR